VAAYALNDRFLTVIASPINLAGENLSSRNDWGAAVAWSGRAPASPTYREARSAQRPSLVMRKFSATRPRQLLRSWYKKIVFLFTSWLPEAVFSHSTSASACVPSALQRQGPSLQKNSPNIAEHGLPGALTGMINWYRASSARGVKFQTNRRVPTRILWGERDAFLLAEMAHESLRYWHERGAFTFANATHWLRTKNLSRLRLFD